MLPLSETRSLACLVEARKLTVYLISHLPLLAWNNNMYMYLDRGLCRKQDGNSCFITLQIICPFELFPHLSFP